MKEAIQTSNAPQAIGPYSQAIKTDCSKLVFCSGQIPLDPQTKKIVGETAAEQCRQVMDNLNEVIKAAGGTFENVVKTTIFLTDLKDFAQVNEVYGAYFESDPPARATIQAAGLPMAVKVEIDAILAIK
ncbi:MAG: RidA family protein [candidate division Zixibacteria bacterium]|nr:RidA family protein [candidate division Zixibacteria bacterium]